MLSWRYGVEKDLNGRTHWVMQDQKTRFGVGVGGDSMKDKEDPME